MTSHAVTELEFRFAHSGFYLFEATDRAEFTLDLVRAIPRSDGELLEYFDVSGPEWDRVPAELASARNVRNCRVDRARGAGPIVEVVTTDSVTMTVADQGAIVTCLSASKGSGRITVEVPGHREVCSVIERVRAAYPAATLTAKRQTDRTAPLFTRQQFRGTLVDTLTRRQYEVLEAAFVNGYFAWPRETNSEALACELGISTATLSQHLRIAERKVLAQVFS